MIDDNSLYHLEWKSTFCITKVLKLCHDNPCAKPIYTEPQPPVYNTYPAMDARPSSGSNSREPWVYPTLVSYQLPPPFLESSSNPTPMLGTASTPMSTEIKISGSQTPPTSSSITNGRHQFYKQEEEDSPPVSIKREREDDSDDSDDAWRAAKDLKRHHGLFQSPSPKDTEGNDGEGNNDEVGVASMWDFAGIDEAPYVNDHDYDADGEEADQTDPIQDQFWGRDGEKGKVEDEVEGENKDENKAENADDRKEWSFAGVIFKKKDWVGPPRILPG